MKKIPTLFKRNYEGDRLVYDEITEGCEWVITDISVTPTRKLDGTACLIKEGKLYKRYELKKGRTPPLGFFPAQSSPDTEAGDLPGWVPVEVSPENRYHLEAFRTMCDDVWYSSDEGKPSDGTYELCGPKVQGNPEHFKPHKLVPHGLVVLPGVPTYFSGLREYLRSRDIEGIVWHHSDGRMAKLKGKDFGLKRLSLE